MRSHRIPLVLIALATVFSRGRVLGEEPIRAQKVVEVLRLLAAQAEANYRRIETWQGLYQFTDRCATKVIVRVEDGQAGKRTDAAQAAKQKTVAPELGKWTDAIVVRTGTVRFVFDARAEKLFVDFDENVGAAQVFARADGRRLYSEHYKGYSQRALITPSEVTTLKPNVKFGELGDYPDDPVQGPRPKGRVAERGPVPRLFQFQESGEIIDPRHFFHLGTSLAWDELKLYANAREGQSGKEAKERTDKNQTLGEAITADDHFYVLTTRFLTLTPADEKGLPRTVARFSKKAQFLPVEWTRNAAAGFVTEYRRWEYESVAGVLIPKTYHYTFNRMEDGSLILDRHLVQKHSTLNERLPEAATSIAALGLEKGDRIRDEIEKQLHMHDGTKLVAVSRYAPGERYASPIPAPWSLGPRLLLVSVSVVLLVVLFAILAWRRLRKRASGA